MENIKPLSEERICGHGGAIPIYKKLKKSGIRKVIKKFLGDRPKQSRYSYEDIIISRILTQFCFGNSLSKTSRTKEAMKIIPELKVPSHDTMGRVMKKLATPNQHRTNIGASGDESKLIVNEHELLSELLIAISVKTGILRKRVRHIMDVDATILKSKTRGADPTYKDCDGYNAMVCMIDKIPVAIDMRSGNTAPSYDKLECIIKCLELLKKYGVQVGTVRIDSAGYNAEIAKYLDSHGYQVLTGTKTAKRTLQMALNSQWVYNETKTATNVWDTEYTSFDFSFSAYTKKGDKVDMYKMHSSRTPDTPEDKTKGQRHEGYKYKYVFTNIKNIDSKKLFQLYHQRGTSEKNFGDLKNNFGWDILPFSNLNENAVYLFFTTISNNVFRYLLKSFSKVMTKLKNSFTLKTFKAVFIEIMVKVVSGKYKFQTEDREFLRIARR